MEDEKIILEEVDTCTDIQSKIYDLLNEDRRVIYDIIKYLVNQGFYLYSSGGQLYYLNSIFNLIKVEIDCRISRVKLDINRTTYVFKVNSKTFTDLIRIIETNLDNMRKNESESN